MATLPPSASFSSFFEVNFGKESTAAERRVETPARVREDPQKTGTIDPLTIPSWMAPAASSLEISSSMRTFSMSSSLTMARASLKLSL